MHLGWSRLSGKVKFFIFLLVSTAFASSIAFSSYAHDGLTGIVVAKDNPGYENACTLRNYTEEINSIKPACIVYCKSIEDVVNAIKWSQANHFPVSIRSGGHNYEGYSLCEGLVIDLSPMKQISLSGDLSLVKVGAGCTLTEIYNELWKCNRTIIGGTCGTVGISGFTLGGGFGLLSRRYGLAIDRLVEIEVVDAEGRLLVANQTQNSDLFWACRGAGGGNFGVVTSLTFKTIPIDQVVLYKIVWPWNDTAEVLLAWQSWAPKTVPELTCVLVIPTKDKNEIFSTGIFLGKEEDLRDLLSKNLLKAGNPKEITVQTMSWIEAVKKLDNPSKSKNFGFKAKSDYVSVPWNQDAIEVMVQNLSVENPKIGIAMVILDNYGGAINQVPEQATAFVHRKDLFSIQYLAYWEEGDAEAPSVNRKWMADFYQQIRPYVSGHSYQNYVDSDLDDWLEAYYGINQERLKIVKQIYDPSNFFHFKQSIP